MYMCVRGKYFVSVLRFFIGFWNCSDDMTFFFILKTLHLTRY